MSFALVFSGQGTQHPAMLPWLRDDGIVRSMCDRLGIEDWRAAMIQQGWAERNEPAQLLLTGLALAAWHQLAAHLPSPSAMAGYSVGELAAFSVAGVYDVETALNLARDRAQAMDRCGEQMPGGLMAVGGLALPTIEHLCEGAGLSIAIRNGPESFVLGGSHEALRRGEESAQAQGARCTRLKIAIASHTPLMRDAVSRFERTLAGIRFEKPRVALFSNASDRVRDGEDAKRALAMQIACTVRWDDCMENLRARQVDCVLEIGPGQALARMWNERYPEVPARSCDEFRSVKGVATWLMSHGA